MEKPHGFGMTDMRPVRLPLRTVPNCFDCPKIPKDAPGPAPQFAIELSERNWQAYRHYQESKAVGFSDVEKNDAIVRRNASILLSVEESQRPDVGRKIDLLLGVLLKGGR